MNYDLAADLLQSSLLQAVIWLLPLAGALAVAGLVVGVLQAATQIQDQSLSTVPRLLVAGVVLLVLMPWLLDQLVEFTTTAYRDIPANTAADFREG